MDPGAPNFGNRLESGNQIFTSELPTISVAPLAPLSFRLLAHILIRNCFMPDTTHSCGDDCF